MSEPRRRSEWLADLALIAITAIWGTTFVVVKDALERSDAFTFLALRFGCGAVAATAFAGRRMFDRTTVKHAAVLGVLLYVGFALQTLGLELTTPSRSAFITGLAVLLVPAVSYALFRRLPRAPSVLGIVFAVAGLWFLTQSGGVAPGGVLLGDALTLACAVAYAFHIGLNERYAPLHSATALVAWQLWIVSFASVLTMPFVSVRLEPAIEYWLAILMTGVLASALAIVVQTWAQARTTAVRAALIFSLEPVFAALISLVLGRERLGPPEWIGGGLILGGVLLAEIGNAWTARALTFRSRA